MIVVSRVPLWYADSEERNMLSSTAQRILRTDIVAKRAGFSLSPEEIALALRLPVSKIYESLQELEEAGHVDLAKPMLMRCA